MRVWAIAARPKTLVATFAPALIALSLALSHGSFKPLLFLMTLLTGLLIQIGTNFTNDYCDFIKGADTNERKGFLRVTQAGLIDPATMRKSILLIFSMALLCGAYLILNGGIAIALLMCLYLLLSVLYTAGPYPLGYLGLGDLLVFAFYGPGACLITYYLQTDTLCWQALFIGLCPGALSTAILVINNIRDIDEDRQANKKTLIVRFGRRFGKIEFALLVLGAFLPPLALYRSYPFALLTLLALPQAAWIVLSIAKNKDPHALNPLFERMGKLLWLFTLLLFTGLIL